MLAPPRARARPPAPVRAHSHPPRPPPCCWSAAAAPPLAAHSCRPCPVRRPRTASPSPPAPAPHAARGSAAPHAPDRVPIPPRVCPASSLSRRSPSSPLAPRIAYSTPAVLWPRHPSLQLAREPRRCALPRPPASRPSHRSSLLLPLHMPPPPPRLHCCPSPPPCR
nr:vegetative cell wall protein gp1-like [Aegilops tauschii subsp. strangulata]